MQRVIVIGASLGGVPALIQLTAGLPPNFPAPIFIVLHIGEHPSLLPSLLARRCQLPVHLAKDGDPINSGEVYVAAPDHHLLITSQRISLTRGAKEHHTRPAIDPLFRSAATAYSSGAIGVILTGCLDDGTAGLQAIKAFGGTTIVQDPDDAAERSMPDSALRNVEVDHCVPLALIPSLLTELSRRENRMADLPPPESPSDSDSQKVMKDRLEHEIALMRRDGVALKHLQAIGKPSTFTCPDCHGDLWELFDSRPQRYRCHTGHAFTLSTLYAAMGTGADHALENAYRALQEKQLLLEHMATDAISTGSDVQGRELLAVASRLQRHASLIAGILEEADD